MRYLFFIPFGLFFKLHVLKTLLMRRLRILFYWLFNSKNNISLKELFLFLIKSKVDIIAKRYIKEIIKHSDFTEVTFNNCSNKLYWSSKFPIEGMFQVTTETFDKNDWHFYQYEKTQIENGDILLDIGTAEGLFPLTVIDKCSHIFMIEPSKVFKESLHKTFEIFNAKTTIFNVAVGSEEGVVNFNEDSLDGQISRSNEVKNTIALKTIDSLIKDKKITYLKADIEGFEYDMLLGAKETITINKPKIAITTYHKQNNYKEIIALIKSYVPEYNYFIKGIHGEEPKPVMVHFWIE